VRYPDATTPFAVVARHECDCCGGSPTDFSESLGLYICAACHLPTDKNPTEVEWAAWRATMRFAAGMRAIRGLEGQKVSSWFVDRYRRLGLSR